ncbi:MAG: translation initiation factor IF-2, partial [Parcubacteria group bacterium Athens0416_74]
IARLGDEYARVSIVQSGIGNISEGDVKTALAGSAHALIIGFNVGIDSVAEPLARERNVQFEFFNIIYKLTERMEELLRSAQPKRTVEEIVGRAKILKVFSSRKDEHVFGGAISEGYLGKNSTVRIVRRKVVVGEGKLLNIQANKQNVDRAEAPSEFGAQLESSFEPAEGDIIECFTSKIV